MQPNGDVFLQSDAIQNSSFMTNEIKDIELAISKLLQAINTDSEDHWDSIINIESEIENIPASANRIHIRTYGEFIIDSQSGISTAIEFLIATYDNDNIRITIDASRNHTRSHIHIGIKQDKYHSISIAIDDGTILNNTGNIASWKVKKIVDWVCENREIIEKIYRCINPWGDTASAEKRKNRLADID